MKQFFTAENLKIIGVCIGVLFGTIAPLVISLIRSIKARKQAKIDALNAQSEAEKAEAEKRQAQAEMDMLNFVTALIENTEVAYKEVDAFMKAKGSTAGKVKKDVVMTKAESYAIKNGNEFDAEKWSNKIDELVKVTRNVNGK